ncbi:hypothetical protein [Streptacidiphilus carbonis]|uniref:hypothetical protein n=1 Tax=Streptacidiphilus carbonis TaxID=105422 RepID=UPI001269DC40|nr:hypothetical protein [Streptacidiphilus carbonis]
MNKEPAIEPSTAAADPTTAAAAKPEASTGDGDQLRHIICVRCFPAFDGVLRAPHDAVCICGKPVRMGERRPGGDVMHCILCDELRDYHNREKHSPGR